ncbi:MAG: packaged DNA stabilization protein gp10 [Hyphomonas sp.]|nr:packaged DNA stabilization protein gp10 [Hyphomonas sp.]
MQMARVAAGHYEPDGVGDGRKVCINLYSELNENDPNRPMRHVVRPGSLDRDLAGVLSKIPRGIGQTDGHASGHVLVVDDVTVRTFDPSTVTWGTLTGSLAGSDRVQMAFSEVEGAILANGSIYVSTGSAVAAATDADYATLLSNHSQTAFTSITSLGQRLIATYGSRFCYSDTLDFNNTTTLSFYTAESSPDALVAAVALQGSLYLFGTETIERWIETGDNDAPFRPQTSSVMNRGCLARDTIAQLDNTLFFVGDDYAVYRLNGLTPVLISKPWLARKLRAENASDLVASYMELEGHSFYILNGKNGCYVYDASTREWFVWETYDQNTWEWSQTVEAAGNHYAISRLGSNFAQLSRDYPQELGVEIVIEWSAHLPVIGGRRPIPSIRVDGTKGRGSAADITQDAYISMALSKDNGITRGAYRSRSIGKQGEYRKRAIWRQNGRAREPQVIAFFRSNDPMIVNGVAVGED